MTNDPINENNKQVFFKRHFIAVIEDLRENGFQDGEAMAMIGSLGQTLAESMGQKTWTATKAACDSEHYNALLKVLTDKGNQASTEGLVKQAYAIQAISTALVASTQRDDAHIAEGEPLLDEIIDEAIVFYDTYKNTVVN